MIFVPTTPLGMLDNFRTFDLSLVLVYADQ